MNKVFLEFETKMDEEEYRMIFEENLKMVGFSLVTSDEIDYAGRPGAIYLYVDEERKHEIEVLFVPDAKIIGFYSADPELVGKCERMFMMINI